MLTPPTARMPRSSICASSASVRRVLPGWRRA